MARLRIAIRADAPLSLGGSKAYGGTLIETGFYVSGGQLRGALAAVKEYCDSSEECAELDTLLGTEDRFGLRFPNCYLTNDPDRPAYPAPITAQTCKRSPGLISERGTRNARVDELGGMRHGVADTLLIQLAYDAVARDSKGGWRIPLPFQYKCEKCGHRTENFVGIIEYRSPGKYHKPSLSTHRQTRVAINRARLTSEDGQLYSVKAIDEGSLFVGELDTDVEREALARKWLPRIRRMGGRISRGFGCVTVKVDEPKKDGSLRDRIGDFNALYRRFEEELRDIAIDPPPKEGRTLFTVNLRSDAVLRERVGAPTLRFDERMLRERLTELIPDEETGINGVTFSFVAQFALPEHVSGWQTAWKLPKEVWLAAQMSGLYVFAADLGGMPHGDEQLADWLGVLQGAGIGELREDGFGQIVVCDPFHLEVNPV
jgi:CRISPR-associated protein Csx10